MRHILKWQLFLNEKLQVSANDKPDVKLSKEKLNSLEEQIIDFGKKKSDVEQIYKDFKDDKEIKKELESLLGPETGGEKSRNIFLVKWAEVQALKKSIEDLVDKNSLDKVTLDDERRDMGLVTSSSVKSRVAYKIKEIELRIKKNLDDIGKKFAEVQKKEAGFKLEMEQFKRKLEEAKKKVVETKPK